MAHSGTGLINQYFVKSPAGLLKIAELVFGGGAWVPLIASVSPLVREGPFAFYLWVTLGSWALVLLTYVFHLFKRNQVPNNKEEHRTAGAPDLCDLGMNRAIAVLYFIAIVAFGVYIFPPTKNPHVPEAGIVSAEYTFSPKKYTSVSSTGTGVFVIIMAALTFFLHLVHAVSLLTYFMMGKERWKRERRWIWQQDSHAQNFQQRYQQPIYELPQYPPGGPMMAGVSRPQQANVGKPIIQTGMSYQPAVPSQTRGQMTPSSGQ